MKIRKNRSGGRRKVFYPLEYHPNHFKKNEITSLNPPDTPRKSVRVIRGEFWVKELDHPNWVEMGHCPAPKTVFHTFVYHFCMGALMHYPLLSILRFCLHNLEPWPDEPVPTPPMNNLKKANKKRKRGWKTPIMRFAKMKFPIWEAIPRPRQN